MRRNPNAHTYSHTDANGESDRDCNSNGNCDAYTYSNFDSYSDTYAYFDTQGDVDAEIWANAERSSHSATAAVRASDE